MKKLLTFVIVTVALLAAGQAFASQVTSVELSCFQGSTVASINVEGTVRFTHQTEEAKDGKPFRVIVDILSATHMLGANNFMSLPNSPVKAIRSSQYSVKPEAVVRVVFDMETEQVYRVDSDNKKITLNFADKSKRQFASWSTASVVSAKKTAKKESCPARVEKAKEVKVASAPAKPIQKSAVELNKSIKKDHLASLEPKAASVTKPAKTKKVVKKTASSTPKLSQSETHYGPYVDATLLDDKKATAKSTKPKAKAKPVVAKALTEPAKTTSVPAAKAPAKSEVKSTPVKSKSTAKKPTPVVAKAKPKAEKKTQKVAKVEKDKATGSKKSTSRFRRSPVMSKKILGTLVAEFPKRLVIKYKSRNHRDPFATLIDESKQNNDPVEKMAPNVEGLKLVGVIETGAKDNRALFEDNEGTGYILRSGDKVRKGYVLRVESDRVYFQIFEYGWSRTVALHLES